MGIPSRFEGKYVRGPVLKAIWCCCQILTYALRPMFIKAQDFTPNHLYNWISQIAFDLVVFYDNLAVCDSWCGVIWDYIMRQEVGPYNRMKRSVPVGDFGAAEAVLRAKNE